MYTRCDSRLSFDLRTPFYYEYARVGDGTGLPARPCPIHAPRGCLSIVSLAIGLPLRLADPLPHAPSAHWRMSRPGGRESRAGTSGLRLDVPKGPFATTRSPGAGEATARRGPQLTHAQLMRTGRVGWPLPTLRWGFLGAGSDDPPPSNPGLPAGTWGGRHLLRCCERLAWSRSR